MLGQIKTNWYICNANWRRGLDKVLFSFKKKMDNLKLLQEQVVQFLQEYFAQTTLFLVDLKVLTNGKIEVFADGQTNITIDECATINRSLNRYLEENGLLKDNTAVEVSSPGFDEPLKVPQQFAKQMGKQVEVVLKNGQKIIGELLSADEKEIKVKEEIATKKKKEVETEEHTLTFEEIKSVKKHFNFKF